MDDDARLVRWKLQNFQLKGRYLFYAEPRPGSKPARLDLGDVMKIEIANRAAPGSPKPTREPSSPTPERKVLYIYVDSTRRHRLRELRNGSTPAIDDWLDALQEAMLKCRESAPLIAPPIADESSLAPAGAAAASFCGLFVVFFVFFACALSFSSARSSRGASAGRDPPPAGPGFFFCACAE
jgi:hypothetical protein